MWEWREGREPLKLGARRPREGTVGWNDIQPERLGRGARSWQEDQEGDYGLDTGKDHDRKVMKVAKIVAAGRVRYDLYQRNPEVKTPAARGQAWLHIKPQTC